MTDVSNVVRAVVDFREPRDNFFAERDSEAWRERGLRLVARKLPLAMYGDLSLDEIPEVEATLNSVSVRPNLQIGMEIQVQGSRLVSAPPKTPLDFYAMPQTDPTVFLCLEKLIDQIQQGRVDQEVFDRSRLVCRALDLVAPIGRGQRQLEVAPPKAGKTVDTIARALALAMSGMHVIYAVFRERPEEVTRIRKLFASFQNIEIWASDFLEKSLFRSFMVADLAAARARQLAMRGEHVGLIVDSMTRLATEMKDVVDAHPEAFPNPGAPDKGGLVSVVRAMMRRYVGNGACLEDSGSITMIATVLLTLGSNFEVAVLEALKGASNSDAFLDPQMALSRHHPGFNVRLSSTRMDAEILGEERAKLYDTYLMPFRLRQRTSYALRRHLLKYSTNGEILARAWLEENIDEVSDSQHVMLTEDMTLGDAMRAIGISTEVYLDLHSKVKKSRKPGKKRRRR